MTLLLTGVGLSACAQAEPPKLDDRQWCSSVKQTLIDNGIGWPVANRHLGPEELSHIERIFENYAAQASGDLEVSAEGWLEGFKSAKPYLIQGDKEAFKKNVSSDLQKQLLLANNALTTICQWNEW